MRKALLFVVLGVGTAGAGLAQLVDTGVTFSAPAQVKTGVPLSPPAAARFKRLDVLSFEFVHIIPAGTCESVDGGVVCIPTTHAKFEVGSNTLGRISYKNEYSGETDEDTMQIIVPLMQSTIFPAAEAACSDLQDQVAYPRASQVIEYMGISGRNLSAFVRGIPALAGLPEVPCLLNEAAPAQYLAQFRRAINQNIIPAIGTEIGIRTDVNVDAGVEVNADAGVEINGAGRLGKP